MARENFSGSIGALLVLAGSAVGLGNIWRFPYMVAENGGGAFILIYILCMLLVSMPVLLSEITVGRRSRKTAYGSLGGIRKEERHGQWKWLSFLFVLIPTVTLSYYSVIGGWTLKYFTDSCAFRFSASQSTAEIAGMFGTFASSTWAPLAFFAVFMLATCLIIWMGVKKGIENFSKVMMPALFVIMCLLAVRSMTIPAVESSPFTARDGIRFLFSPDFSKVTARTFVEALGQAFFSLSIGMGIMLTYGSYLGKEENLLKTASYTAVADLIFAVISGCVVIPAMFAYGMFIPDPATGDIIANPEISAVGAGLVYKTLPVVFSQMPMGNVVAIFFFFSVILAALTSAMSLFEVPVSWLVESRHMSRGAACLTTMVVTFAIGTVCSLSFGKLDFITVKDKNIFDMCDWIIANVMMPLAGFVCVLFCGWGMKKAAVRDEMTNGGKLKGVEKAFPVLYGIIRFLAPAGVIAVAVSSLGLI